MVIYGAIKRSLFKKIYIYWHNSLLIFIDMKQQINEIRRMQQLAGLITESQLNEAEKTVSFGPFTNVEWYKVGGENIITLTVTDSDNFREIENAMDFEGRDYMTDEEISYLNDKVEEIADKMSDYLTSIGIENEILGVFKPKNE